jgi:SsrA-binding protein
MSKSGPNMSPRISNRRALHDYHIEAKLECGISLVGSEVKSLRQGTAQLHEAFARVENGELILHGCYIDPYHQAAIVYNHEPARERKLLAHRREIKKLADLTAERGVTLIPIAIYFKDGRAKVELAVARSRKVHDKREVIKRREQDRDLRRAMTRRQPTNRG